MQQFEFDQLTFDPADGRLANRDGSMHVHLRPQAGTLLRYLLEHPGSVIDKDTLCREIWDADAVVDFESGLAALLRELRQALERLGSDAGLIETVPRRGYRLRAKPATPNSARSSARMQGLRRRRWTLAGLTVAAAAIIVALVWRTAVQPAADPGPHQLAILPLERFGETDFPPERAGIRLADTILAELWRAELEELQLIGRAGMRPYVGRDDAIVTLTRDLGVDLLIEGTLRAESGRWQVDLRVLAVPPGRVIWSQTLSGNEAAVPVSDIASGLVSRLQRDWPTLQQRLEPR